MDRVKEIEIAVESLPVEDYRRFAEWFRERDQKEWDEQLDRDSASGKLDFLFEEADAAANSGRLHEWPPAK